MRVLLDTVLPGDKEGSLISKAQGGDKGAFSRLVESHEQFVHDVCCRVVGDREDGEDLAQETFLRAYRGLKRFRSQSAFRTWLYRIAVNLCLSHKARHRPAAVSSEDLDEEMPSETPQPERRMPYGENSGRECGRLLRRCPSTSVLSSCCGMSRNCPSTR